MTDPILQSRLPHLPWMDPATARLPGVQPVQGDDWLRVDDAFDGQMDLRDRLLADRPDVVHALLPEARAAADELYGLILARLARTPGYTIGTDAQRPDGVTVPLDPGAPLLTLGRLVQEDLCLLQEAGEEYRLTGAVLCFPASWSLAEKLGRSMVSIHAPVQPYTEDIARRVGRMFQAIRPEQPLWRQNFLTYDDATLHQPRREGERRPRPTGHFFVRSERQCFVRLPETRAVVFAIHTYVVRAETLTAPERAALLALTH